MILTLRLVYKVKYNCNVARLLFNAFWFLSVLAQDAGRTDQTGKKRVCVLCLTNLRTE